MHGNRPVSSPGFDWLLQDVASRNVVPEEGEAGALGRAVVVDGGIRE